MVRFEHSHLSWFLFLFLLSFHPISAEISENVNVLGILREMVRHDLLLSGSDINLNVEDFKGVIHIVKRAAENDDVTGNSTEVGVTQLPFTRSNCRKYLMIMAKRLMKYLTGCTKQLKIDHPGPGEFDKFFNCALRCSMDKVSILDENGLLSIKSLNVFKTTHVPKRFHNVMDQVMDGCLKQHSTKIKTLKEDPQCLSFGDFFKCTQSFVGDNC